jgi:hypothetical protein
MKALLFSIPLLFLGCNAFNGSPNYFLITVNGQTFSWSGNSMTSIDGKAIYLSSQSSVCGGKNAIQMWEGDAGMYDFYCACFVPDGEGNFPVGDQNATCANMMISGPWAYSLISGVETSNGNIATPIVNITHEGMNVVEGTISGTIAESNQNGTFVERSISGSFKLRKM